jgi:hypothetical protein
MSASVSALPRFARLPRIGLAAALVAAMIVAVLSVGTPARASAGPRCGTGSSSGNVTTCITINGPGLYVSWILATAQVNDSTRTIQVCIHGPASPLPKCSPFQSTSPGTQRSAFWNPNRDEPAGDYCANTWRQNSDLTHTLIGQECVNVHA